jgi:hypothetical protein
LQALRRTASRPQQQLPPGYYEFDDPAVLAGMPGLQRRNTTEQQPTRPPMSNMGIPSQQAPSDPFRMNIPPPNTQDRGMAPPPGFAPRPPPGFGQGPPPQLPHSVGNTPLGHPGLRDLRDPRGIPQGIQGMFGGPGMPPPSAQMGPPGYFGGPPPGPPQGLQNAPPPPGFGPGPGPRDPRELFLMQQVQAQQQQQGRFAPDDMGRGGRMPPGFM